jgi:hypothetical protein
MNGINGSSHCHSKHKAAPQVQQGAPTQSAHGGQTPKAGSGAPAGPQSLANTLSANRQLNNGWQGRQDGRVRVAVIDDFATNHGQEIDGIIRSGGATASGAVQGGTGVETIRFNINNGGNRTRNIANSLDQIAGLAAQGQQFDAINISQQDFSNSADAAAVREKIDLLQRQFGIPVVVAAGNNANGVRNALAGSAAFVVENSVVGSDFRSQGSGVGNVRSEGRFTSQAAANVTARVAQLRELGYSFSQIQQFLLSESSAEGGSLDGIGI